jgi:Flp pilus assembly protein TadG
MFKRFSKSTNGSMAIITALAMTVVLGAAGAAIDYSRYSDKKTVYTAAADAAALAAAAVVSNQPGWTEAKILAEAKARALATWKANLSPEEFNDLPNPNIAIVPSAGGYTATVTFDRPMPTTFLAVVGMGSIKLLGSSQASGSGAAGRFWEFHIAIDTSSSMGIGATQADMDKMQKDPKIGCAFACHSSAKGNDSVSVAKAAGYTLRVDVVDQAVDGMVAQLDAMNALKTKAALYGIETKLTPLVALTPDLKQISGHDIQLALTSQSIGNTNLRTTMAQLTAAVGMDGTGQSAAKAKKAVFIVTDGIHDSNTMEPNVVIAPWKSHALGPIDPAFCTKMKANGVTVGVLYINYITPKGFESWINPFLPKVQPTLKSCASEGMFYNATSPADIAKAMKDMLAQSLEGEIRLTQ